VGEVGWGSGIYLVVFTREYVPARAFRICCSVLRFSTFLRLFGRADASAAKARSVVGTLIRSIVVVWFVAERGCISKFFSVQICLKSITITK
jgi:hypothetical protein